jgi:polyhydroxyalkanoate synthase
MTEAGSATSREQFAAQLKAIENANVLVKVMTTRAAIAQTPKELIWTLNKAKLYRYVPRVAAEKRHRVPLLLVFALINRPYILDLRPGNSFVEYLVDRGYDVYLLDWGSPGLEDRKLKLDDYVLDYMVRAIRKVKVVSGSPEFSLLGWCIGSILATIYAAVRPDDGLRNLILLTAPLDFSNKEEITFARWLAEIDIDKVVEHFGNIPAEMIEYGARALKPVENYIGNYMRLWENLDNPQVIESWHAMNTWVTDNIPMAGEAGRQLMTKLYRENQLINSQLEIRGERVDLRRIRASLLNVIADKDHIAPPCQSESIMEKVSSTDQELLHVSGGHIGIMTGSRAIKATWPHMEQWLAKRSN